MTDIDRGAGRYVTGCGNGGEPLGGTDQRQRVQCHECRITRLHRITRISRITQIARITRITLIIRIIRTLFSAHLGRKKQRRKHGACLFALHGEVQQHRQVFAGNRSVRTKRLAQVERVEVVDRHLCRHIGGERAQGEGAGVYHHLAVEGRIERVASPENNNAFILGHLWTFDFRLLTFRYIIAVIEVAAGSEGGEERVTHDRDGVGVEIQVPLAAKK